MLWPLGLPNACCLRGHVALAPANTPPERVRQLLTTPSFLEKIRGYNSAFAFTSTGAKEDSAINRGNAPYTFRVNGSMNHRIGHLLPRDGAAPAFAQIYSYDGSTEVQVALRGSAISSGLNPIILGELQTILNDVNPLAATYRSAREYADSSQEMCLVLFEKPNTDPRRYSRSTAEGVAAIMVNGDPAISRRDVVLHYRSGGFLRIFETHPLYDPLQYPLIYLRGEEGWSTHARYVDGVRRNHNPKVSLREHTAYRLYMKHQDVEYSLLHRSGRLMQQWCVDQAAKIIEQRLFFQRRLNTQHLYRRELFSGLQVLMLADHALVRQVPDLHDTGIHTILSSKFPGGVRYIRQQYYDSMVIVRQFGKPDLFITVTTNPK
ncbi:hypothetical protein PC129_g9584 [Phytophthora cactorum]|uniref:Helitron helicase-like domain-containing protein n=1 Tax=Phytophthora cactorum TaxID=29920 RepID=A0A8T1KBX9_9STRA|nr:hypothetical protein Pcac1_g9242 [Phytophthora cactorum]KAG2799061.1 hypothetical protein PC112_g21078 [Phytophthora cactorum]KAG2799072.1 hypothetical protein PC111_g20575 [Phytophthora cactorum]KAG2861038.1 hypothetical protein PC113_g7529 [Phytophthora cactorum]KAG2886080.1 hypothetical protein PC115_g20773 [Phytophthora cactorum]